MHHKDTYLCLKPTAIPHLCPAGNARAPVCVPPGGPPEGILDIAEYIVCLVVFLLFLFGPQKFFRRILIFFGEKTHVALFFFALLAVVWPPFTKKKVVVNVPGLQSGCKTSDHHDRRRSSALLSRFPVFSSSSRRENDDDASADQRLCFGSSEVINKNNNNSVRLALVLEKK